MFLFLLESLLGLRWHLYLNGNKLQSEKMFNPFCEKKKTAKRGIKNINCLKKNLIAI